jgi:hypothetical protein
MAQIKGFLVFKLERMDAAAHDYVANAYQAIIDKWAGDYDRAALEQGPELLQLITKMQDDYRVYHNHGYETVEGITAGTKAMVALQAKTLTDQLDPHLRQLAAVLNLRIPPKPTLS